MEPFLTIPSILRVVRAHYEGHQPGEPSLSSCTLFVLYDWNFVVTLEVVIAHDLFLMPRWVVPSTRSAQTWAFGTGDGRRIFGQWLVQEYNSSRMVDGV